jgi:hypothetical protein
MFLAPSLPSIQHRELKYPEFGRTATHWKKFTSSFIVRKKGNEKPLPRTSQKCSWLLHCPAFSTENLSTLSSAVPLRTGRISLPALKDAKRANKNFAAPRAMMS